MGPAKVIVADTSALLAIQFDEPECGPFLDLVKRTDKVLVSTVSVVEARMVVYSRRGHAGVLALDRFIERPVFEIIPPGPEEAKAAYEAFVLYGKGNGHPAALNLGDLFAYALAKTWNLPLLFKGNDFAQTDLAPAWAAPGGS
ncbi:type II toxin-antitoxin system VapC family toxin [Chelativorans sp.]|uniref:type II toxin-antitoxin system VapC family toxin n=1 Tax=Chelativorans sp. TaxID=2203393 RepID=UPI002811F9A9|nr:type II toxin-antitoxin system VapC family toxin [Chelativorans sp.]